MTKDIYKVYLAIYNLLDEIYQNTKQEDLLRYLSDADPTVCNDGESLDPSVFSDFKSIFERCIDDNMSDYDFLAYYLANLDPYYGNIKKYFDAIPKEDCINQISSLLTSK